MTQTGRSPLDPWIEIELAAASGRRTILVDGFNVLHTVLLAGARDSAWWGRAARERLLERVAGWPVAEDDLWVAFDGMQPAWSVLAIAFAGASAGGRARGPIIHSLFVDSADDWIVRRARRAEAPERTVVVSADRKVAGRARSAGCLVWTPWDFIAGCDAAAAGSAVAESSAVGSSAAQSLVGPDPDPAGGAGAALVDGAEVGAPLAPLP
ncbi:MAG: NYN domain-containing protein [Deltaproteobacteria bacterium]|nr:NYN domain-containing protein [Deltaproteobacteria bacterium]